MLQELTIDNLAIIDHQSLTFDDQMTVLTGETGAGKSIIIDAVGLLAGGRGSQEFIRRGSDKLNLQGQFTVPDDPQYVAMLDELGIDYQDGVLIISRQINRNGRNTIRVNGQLVNTSTLKKLGRGLVDIQGQNEHQLLLQPETHLGMLDQFAGKQLAADLADYHQQYAQYLKLKKTISDRQRNEQQWAQRLDMLRYQVKEIGDANLVPDEDEKLTSERERLAHFQQINTALQTIVGVLNDNDGVAVLDQLGTAMDALQGIAKFDSAFEKMNRSLNDAYYTLQDLADNANSQLETLEFDDARLAQIDERLTLIGTLEHKYGDTVTDVLKYYQQIKSELTRMEQSAESADDQGAELAKIKDQLMTLSTRLSENRHRAAKRLEAEVHQQLSALYMDKADFKVHFSPVTNEDGFDAGGSEQVEFYIQTNPGETMGPLVKIASGGELSRVMLALKTIFASTAGITSIIFDEVDTGVSGRVAQAIADKIKLIAKHSQVLCITHLPQVAAVAQHHWHIEKGVHGSRTTTSVRKLTSRQRVDELSRMLAGERITKLTREHASELLKMGQQ
ncbi:DNA repair protein RecN [uncultured Limosilactobacillus sp.]|uniref:DNA repair protein RecN n=1 Tax=uncultured Limosilactobacillus sp. TaxID=2837629 RepID=UPI0025D83D2D|nr:DNA repair protein RecN [uncultured Limosilactobacillus sp.]